MTYAEILRKEMPAITQQVEKFKKEASNNPELARQMLIDIGILTKSGKQLSKKYKN